MPPNPPSSAHGFAMRSMSLRDKQVPKSEKKISWPPLPNPGDAPGYQVLIQNQRGPHPTKWDKSGMIVDVKPYDQYLVKVDGSGRQDKSHFAYHATRYRDEPMRCKASWPS